MLVNGQAAKIAHLQGKDASKRRIAMQEIMLTAYRSSSHPATGVTPYKAAMQYRDIRTKLRLPTTRRTRKGRRYENEHQRF